MDIQINETTLITSHEDLIDYIQTYYINDSDSEVYFTGNNIGHLLNPIAKDTGDPPDMHHIRIMIPSLSAHGILFRSLAVRAGAAVGVTNRAVHDMIIKDAVFILISYIPSNNLTSPLLGMITTQDDICMQAMKTARTMWNHAHRLESAIY